MRMITLYTLVLSLAQTSFPATNEEPLLSTALNGLQKFWDETHSFQSKFSQVVFTKRLGTRDETKGVLYVRKPNCLRWESHSEGSIIILNERKLTHIHQNKRRGTTIVDIHADVSKTAHPNTLGFLAGTERFRGAYSSRLISESDQKVELHLTPKSNTLETYIAEIAKAGYFLLALTVENAETRTRIELSQMVRNVKLGNGLFVYEPKPRDVVHRQ